MPYALLAGAAFIWGLNHVIGKGLVHHLPPFAIATGRFTVAGIVLLAWLLIKRRPLPPGRIWTYILISGLTGIFAFNSMIYAGLQYTSAINSSLINSLIPVVTVFLASLLLKEKLGWHQVGGALLSFLGVALVVSNGSLQVLVNLSFNRGDLIILPSTLVWAVYTIYAKRIMAYIDPIDTTAYCTLVGLPFLWGASLWTTKGGQLPPISWSLAFSLIFLGVFASVLASLSWNTGIERLGAARATIFLNLIPVFSTICSIILLGEKLHLHQALGGLLIFVGIIMATGKAEKRSISQVDISK